MWRDYSKSFLKNNRTSGTAVMVAAFISALLLSLLCSLFYNFWIYEIERIKVTEGDWQGRIVGKIQEGDLETIQNYANVEKVLVKEKPQEGRFIDGEVEVDIYFTDLRRIFDDMSRIAVLLKEEPEKIECHYSLLAMYLIRDAKDTAPRAIFPLLLTMTIMACISLILIIHNSFAVSMNARIHQFGILSTIGASPEQIRTCLLQEAGMLCVVPVAAGNLLGILISMGIVRGINRIAADVPGRFDAVWTYHPLLLVITLLITALTIGISAWIPAWKMSCLTPLEAVKNAKDLHLKRKRSSYLLTFFFGVEGELAGNALRAQKRNLRTATFSLTISFCAFFLMQCFFTLTMISQRMTYYARYQNAWDIMVTVKDIDVDEFINNFDIQDVSGISNAVVYQKAMAKRLLTRENLSEEMLISGGFSDAPVEYVSSFKGGWLVNVPVVILDDVSFLKYCKQIGAEPALNGAVILNRINDSEDPNFRIRNYIPYINELQETTCLQSVEQEGREVEIPVIFYAKEPPLLKEAYDELDSYVLVHFLPALLWKEIKDKIGGAEEDTYIRVLAKKEITLPALSEMEGEILKLVGSKYEVESVNRIQDKITNDNMINGMMLALGGFCALLAMIGIGNVFSNTLGFVNMRKREFARYMSIGITPGGIRKMFTVEAFLIAGRPVLTALLLTVLATGLMIKAAYLEPAIFIREVPVIPMTGFILAVFGFVALAYYLGGRKVLKTSLVEALRDDTLE